ncbi:MAG: Zn-dependent protease [Gammaproteobacteria bacterium]|nr:Zn-dependent protease [Gammaproteobacteria bacterium]HAH67062.1 Zn-dependent protease [Gammaproteobacteria bacterium]|tara:strand:- start:8307 stop:9134 length:828 start_codon:yes stop_codon:yes gene_type:complete
MFKSQIITKLSFCLIVIFSVFKTEAALLVSEREILIESQKAWEQMKTSLPVSRDLSKRTQVNCIAKRIIKQLEEPFVDEDWEIEVFENPGVNAFAMPGGKLGVYTGLFSVASNQDELATVIGHEIAHVTEKHSYERAKREMRTRVGTTIGMAVIAGNMANRQIRSQADIYEMNNQINAVNTMSQILSAYGLNLPFNRQQESDADKTGLRLMAEAGFNPFASLSLWKKMQEDSNRPNLEFVSSHPSSENRIKGLSSQLSEALKLYNSVERKPRCTF